MINPQISAVICTFNRCKRLPESLASLIGQDMEPAEYEIIVVDNNSKDRTEGVAREFINSNKTHDIRYIFEKTPGLSNARNRAVAEAKAEILAFIDDDGVADSGWLRNLLKAYELKPEAACAGGKIEILWPIKRPQWLPEGFEVMFAGFNLGSQIKRLEFPLYPYGTNFSVKKSIFYKTGGFSASLGRIGYGLLSSEEKEFCHKLYALGAAVFYAPDAVVRHKIDSWRISRRYLWRQAYWHSVSDVIFNDMKNRFSKSVLCKRGLAEAGRLFSIIREILADLIKRRQIDFLNVFSLFCRLGKLRQYIVFLLTPGR